MARRKKASQRELDLLAEIQDLSTFYDGKKDRSPSAAMQAKMQIARLQAELHRIQRGKEIEALTDPVARLRAQAAVAAEEGSWVATERLATAAARLELEAAAQQALAQSEALEGASEDELAKNVIDGAVALPRPLQARLALDLLLALSVALPDDLANLLEAEAEAQ